MEKVLVTGGTVFVSKYAAAYFARKGYDVYVLNRGMHQQADGVTLIQADRGNLGNCLRQYKFNTILDITAYTDWDIKNLLKALTGFENYIFISSSAVYPETLEQPFNEEQQVGANVIWGSYGLNKIKAEQYLREHVPNAYILRPSYLYGPMQNLYREPFIFDCAMKKRTFYIPKDGTMPLQFFHVEDLCRLIEIIMKNCPKHHIFNVGNEKVVDINRFVELCYQAAGVELNKVYVENYPNQRDYFSFYDYGYVLDVKRQKQLLHKQKDLLEGLKESYEWYRNHQEDVLKKDYISFIDSTLKEFKTFAVHNE